MVKRPQMAVSETLFLGELMFILFSTLLSGLTPYALLVVLNFSSVIDLLFVSIYICDLALDWNTTPHFWTDYNGKKNAKLSQSETTVTYIVTFLIPTQPSCTSSISPEALWSL